MRTRSVVQKSRQDGKKTGEQMTKNRVKQNDKRQLEKGEKRLKCSFSESKREENGRSEKQKKPSRRMVLGVGGKKSTAK